jgi:hypothetical protein
MEPSEGVIPIQDAALQVQLPFKVQTSLTDIGGPSAGLMTALSVYAITTGTDSPVVGPWPAPASSTPRATSARSAV